MSNSRLYILILELKFVTISWWCINYSCVTIEEKLYFFLKIICVSIKAMASLWGSDADAIYQQKTQFLLRKDPLPTKLAKGRKSSNLVKSYALFHKRVIFLSTFKMRLYKGYGFIMTLWRWCNLITCSGNDVSVKSHAPFH